MLARGVTPVVPSQGSVGASGDLAPLAHMAAAMIGVGEVRRRATRHAGRRGACRSRAGAGRRSARRKGWRCSTARSSRPPCARRPVRGRALFRSALVTGALSTERRAAPTRRSIARIHALAPPSRPDRVAAALRALLAGSAIRASHLTGDDRVQDPYCLRCQPQVMGACLDLLRQAARTLGDRGQRRLRQSADLRRDDEALSGGNFHAEPVAFAADMIALALCEIGSISERRIAHADRSGAVRPAGVPDPEAGPQFRAS